MRQHTQAQPKPTQGYPWFQVKISDDVFHLRIPEIATASSLVSYYSGIVVAMEHASRAASEAASNVDEDTTEESIQSLSETLLKSQQEMYGALGFVVLSCWRDPEWDLRSRAAYLQSYPIRKAIRDNQPLDSFDSEIVSIVEAAVEQSKNLQTDLKTSFGLVCWDELLCHGFTHEALQDIGTACSRLVFESIKSKSGSGVELIANF